MSDRIDALKAAEARELARREEEAKRIASIAYQVFNTEAGQELLHHLIHRYGLLTRTFIPGKDHAVCPYRAAVRDGERAPVSYLIHLIRTHKPDHPIPL